MSKRESIFKNKKVSHIWETFSRLSDLNQSPARYECAALPDELSRQNVTVCAVTTEIIISLFFGDCKDHDRVILLKNALNFNFFSV